MRKIYSIVLMACAMLISVSLSAKQTKTLPAGDQTSAFQEYVNLADDVEITLEGNVTLSSVVNIYSGKKITLNLNGYNITGSMKGNLIVLYHGTLDIVGSGTIANTSTANPAQCIQVEGQMDYKVSDWSVLTIGKDVNILATEAHGKAVVVDGTVNGPYYTYVDKSWIGDDPLVVATDYLTNANYDTYALTTTRNASSISKAAAAAMYATLGYANKCPYYKGDYTDKTLYKKGEASGTAGKIATLKSMAYGVRIVVNGHIEGGEYGIKTNGTVFLDTEKHKQNMASITVSSTAIVGALSGKESAGIASNGYSKYTIQGEVRGGTGVYVKGGEVELNDAVITSTYQGQPGEKFKNPVGQTSGLDAGGSGIVIESNASYAGGQQVTISGDTKISGTIGYGIQETVTTGTGDEVSSVMVLGGTIEAGDQGAMIFDKSTLSSGDDKIQIVGGNVHSEIYVQDEEGNKVNTDIDKFIPNDGNNYNTTEVTDPKTGKTTIVVTKLENGVTIETGMTVAAAAEAGKGLNWTNDDETLTTNATLPYLEINANTPQVLTVNEGVTLTVGRIVMGTQAQIIVKAGARLIVDGEQGIVANNVENIILEANATSQATFVISNKVTSNKQPMASVRYYTDAYGMPKTGTSTNYKWDRLTSPLSEYSKISSNYATLEEKPALLDGETGIWTFIEYYDELNSKWVGLTAYNQMKAFTSYALSNNTKAGGITYTFEGRVQGNVADRIELDHAGWNYMGNAFVAPIHVKSMLSAIENSGAGIDASMYLWDMANQKYIPVNKTQYGYFTSGPKEIPAMQTFIVKLTSGNSANLDLNYAESVYGYVTNTDPTKYIAPRRAMASDVKTLRINVKAANGAEDDVYFVESNEFTAEYESGADITKYMNKGMNFYADGEYAMVASDNIEGTQLSLQTIDDVEYTLTFAEVNGEEYALRDNLTGRIVLMSEGATYRFTAQPNQTVEGRFQIVPRQQMPTDISTANETAGSKAVYTVLGQYVGETENWNLLPAGIYVVDGVKIVK